MQLQLQGNAFLLDEVEKLRESENQLKENLEQFNEEVSKRD